MKTEGTANHWVGSSPKNWRVVSNGMARQVRCGSWRVSPEGLVMLDEEGGRVVALFRHWESLAEHGARPEGAGSASLTVTLSGPLVEMGDERAIDWKHAVERALDSLHEYGLCRVESSNHDTTMEIRLRQSAVCGPGDSEHQAHE